MKRYTRSKTHVCECLFVLKMGDVLEGYDKKTMVLLDPAGLSYMKGRLPLASAEGFSKVLYKKFNLADKPVPEKVKSTIQSELQACYYEHPSVRLIHAVGPRLVEPTYNKGHVKNKTDLLRVYENILMEFFQNAKPDDILRLVPISSGIFNQDKSGKPIYTSAEMAEHSITALFVAVHNLNYPIYRLELYVKEKEDFDHYLQFLKKVPKIYR